MKRFAIAMVVCMVLTGGAVAFFSASAQDTAPAPTAIVIPNIPAPQPGQTPTQYITTVLLSLFGVVMTFLVGALFKYITDKLKAQTLYEQDSMYLTVYRQAANFAEEQDHKKIKGGELDGLRQEEKLDIASNFAIKKLQLLGLEVPEVQNIKEHIEAVLGETR